MSGDPVEQLLRPCLEVEPGILMGLVPPDSRNALHEVKDALGLAAFLGQHHVDDLRCLRLAETPLAQEFGPLVIRNAYTAAANVLTAIGFALLLAAIFALRSANTGNSVSWHQGLMWGLAGFAVFTIAPGLGLPPELPGVPAAPLLSRQIWWVLAAATRREALA